MFEWKSLPEFGSFLSIRWPRASVSAPPAARYPGWRQYRVVGHAQFDLVGPGPEPSARDLAIWAILGECLGDVLSICIGAVRELAARTSEQSLGADRSGYLAALRAALDSGHLAIRAFNFSDGSVVRAVLGCGEIEDFYFSPLVDLDGLQVVCCQFAE